MSILQISLQFSVVAVTTWTKKLENKNSDESCTRIYILLVLYPANEAQWNKDNSVFPCEKIKEWNLLFTEAKLYREILPPTVLEESLLCYSLQLQEDRPKISKPTAAEDVQKFEVTTSAT